MPFPGIVTIWNYNLANLALVWCNSGLSKFYEFVLITQLSALSSSLYILRSSVSRLPLTIRLGSQVMLTCVRAHTAEL